MTESLPDILLRPLVEMALTEDLGRRGDLTSSQLFDKDTEFTLEIVARQAGVLCGIDCARLTFALLDPRLEFMPHLADGAPLEAGSVIAQVRGRAVTILSGERTALNFLSHLSGIATTTAQMAASLVGTKAKITDTRKTLPGLRMLQKYAVRVGGGVNHRLGLDDAILIKDNHLAVMERRKPDPQASTIAVTMERARHRLGHLVKIELEVENTAQIEEILALPPPLWPDVVMLDNMTPMQLRDAVVRLRQNAPNSLAIEASGGVTLDNIREIAATGVDVISSSKLTMAAQPLDIALDEV